VKIKHIIFDLDGTLSATAQATALAIEEARRTFEYLPPVTDAQIKEAMGLHGLEFHMKLFPGVEKEKLYPIEKAIDELELKNITKLGRDILFPGVYSMLEKLHIEGYSLYIASTGSHTHVHGTLEAANIGRFFKEVHCNEPQKINMVGKIVNGNDPSQWAMLGDMFKDSEAARGNNILALGAGFGYLSVEDEKLFDLVLRTPNDMFNFSQNERS